MMAFSDDGICTYCAEDLKHNETEIVYTFYLDILWIYLKGYPILCDTMSYKNNSLLKRLEQLGYLTSMEANLHSALIRPTGVQINNNDVTICANRQEHDAFNYVI